MSATNPLSYHRMHECWHCGTHWIDQVVLCDYTTNLSGEQTSFCPECGKAASMSRAADPCIPDEAGQCKICQGGTTAC